jgi:hypothetical protein
MLTESFRMLSFLSCHTSIMNPSVTITRRPGCLDAP